MAEAAGRRVPAQTSLTFKDVCVSFTLEEWDLLDEDQIFLYYSVTLENFLMATSVRLAICGHSVHTQPEPLRQPSVPDKVDLGPAKTKMIQGSSGPGCGNTVGDENASSARVVPVTVSQVSTLNVGLPMQTCETCDLILKGILHLLGQQGILPGQPSYPCKSCGRTFSIILDQIPQQQNGETSGRMKKGQNKFFKSSGSHTSENALTDRKDGVEVSASSGLGQHHVTNNGQKPYWSTKREASHTHQRGYRCSECGQIFSHKDTCSQNPNSQMGKESYQCNQCGKLFSNHSDFMLHKKSHNKAICYQCTECGKYFKLHTSLEVHLKNHQKILKSYECTECGKVFRRRYYFLEHLNIHTGEKPYKCSECQEIFPCKKTLTQHQKIHNEIKPYSCDRCGKAFSRKSVLQEHQRIHTGEKIYECDECGKCLRYRTSLKTHKKLHSGIRPYECNECGKTYITRAHLIHHKKVHTKARPGGEENVGNSLVATSASLSTTDKTLDQGLMCSASVGESTEDAPTLRA
ncbi:zinc finger protein OZF-like [Molossus molossus]|uniref:zinc finger protein OZF-like n=1 Tax=Molossus molossus TaxID=27622 RepID=UPI001746D4AF|nr:zinc finger protein OZF-like [Molossus molossus]